MGNDEAFGDVVFVGRDFCNDGGCVEAARLPDGRVALRSSLDVDRPASIVTAAEWTQFLAVIKDGRFDTL